MYVLLIYEKLPLLINKKKTTGKLAKGQQHSRLPILTASWLHVQLVGNWENVSNWRNVISWASVKQCFARHKSRWGRAFRYTFHDLSFFIKSRFKHTNTRCTACWWFLGADFRFDCNYRHFDQNLFICLLGRAQGSSWAEAISFTRRTRPGWFVSKIKFATVLCT